MERNAGGVSAWGMLLPRLSVHLTRVESRQRKTHEPNSWWKSYDHLLPATLCRGRRNVGMSVGRYQTRCSQDDTRNGRWRKIGSLQTCEPVLCSGRFAEMQPVFKNVALTRVDLGQFMRWYAEDQYIMTRPRRMLVGSVRGDNILLGTPLLRLYLNQGLEATRVYQVIEYDPKTCFRRYGVRGSTRVRCRSTESHHNWHDEIARKFGVREDNHQHGSASRREILHGGCRIEHDQRSSVPSTRRRRRSEQNLDEQDIRNVPLAHARAIVCLVVRQIARAAASLRFCRQEPGTTSIIDTDIVYFALVGDSINLFSSVRTR